MKDVKVNITSTGFPSQFVSDAEKATDEFGLQVGQDCFNILDFVGDVVRPFALLLQKLGDWRIG